MTLFWYRQFITCLPKYSWRFQAVLWNLGTSWTSKIASKCRTKPNIQIGTQVISSDPLLWHIVRFNLMQNTNFECLLEVKALRWGQLSISCLCLSLNFTWAIKGAQILWQFLALFYSRLEGQYKAKRRKMKQKGLIKKSLLLKAKGYSYVANVTFQMMNFSFLANVSAIFTFRVCVV